MGVLGYDRIDDDFYPSPAWCTEALLRNFKPEGKIWEPACGEGHISKVLQAHGLETYSTDLVDRGYGEDHQDFLSYQSLPDQNIRSIVTNPPYSGSLPSDFILKSLELLKPVGGSVAMLLRNEYDCAAKRTNLFRHPAFTLKLVLTSRPRWIEGSTGSPRHNYSWFCWSWESASQPPTIKWDK